MKSILSYSLLAAAMAAGVATAQTTTATTVPVGYITIQLPGTNGASVQKLQLASAGGLLPSDTAAAAGTAESFASDSGGSFLQDDQGAWVAGNFVNGAQVSHLVEITSGPLQGSITWIKSTAANRLYTVDDLSGAGVGASYRVHKAHTIASLFGDPPTAETLGGGISATAADNVQIFDPVANSYQTFWYKNSGAGGTGWRSSGVANAQVPTTAIHPNDGLVILRKQSSDGKLVFSGSVKTGNTQVRIEGNPSATVLNIVATQFPVDQLTFGNSALYTGNSSTGLKGGISATAADNVLILNAATNTYTTFWYKDSGAGGTGWRATGVADPANYVLPSTGSILIQRKNGGPFSWNIPAVNIAAQ